MSAIDIIQKTMNAASVKVYDYDSKHKYIVYNYSTNEITRVDENNIMSINKNLKKDLELYFFCNR